MVDAHLAAGSGPAASAVSGHREIGLLHEGLLETRTR